jgi:CheY-like chemotaxis protein
VVDVLLIDDDPVVYEDLVVLLPGDIKLRSASSRSEAAQVLKAGPRPDAVILDLCLPGSGGTPHEEEGLDLLRCLRSELAHGIPVIVLSALPRQRAESKCLDLGACIYLEKPCRVADLVWILSIVGAR